MQAIVNNNDVAANADLTPSEIEILRSNLLSVGQIAKEAYDTVLEERSRHARELEELKSKLNIAS